MNNLRVVSFSFIWEQNEDCGPCDSTSVISEKLLPRGREKVRIYVILVKGEYIQSSAYFFRGFLLVS